MGLKNSRVSSVRTGEAVDKEDDDRGDWFVNPSTPIAAKIRKLRNEREHFMLRICMF